VAQVLLETVARQTDCTVLAIKGRYDTEVLRRRVESLDVRYEEVSLRRLLISRLARKLVKEHDLIFLHSGVIGLIGRSLAMMRVIPQDRLVYVPHGSVGYRNSFWRSVERIVTALTPRVPLLFVSPGERDDFVKTFHVTADVQRGVVTPYAILRSTDLGADTPPPLRLIVLGRLVPVKNPKAVAELVNELRRGGLDVRFTWIGDGPLRHEFLSALDEEMRGRVEVTGWVDDVQETLARIRPHFSLLLSAFEAFPQAMLEGMTMGIPPIVADVAGIQGIVVDGVNGLVRSADLVSRISACFEDGSYEQMREQALMTAQERTPERFDQELAAFLDEVT
jgi:glycosyltransferase involved in cell wall biosynthesis